MAIELRQQLKLTQQLIMTPQLQMAIKLLQLSRLELMDAIRQELEENPTLEETQETVSKDQLAEENPEGVQLTERPKEVTIDEKIPSDIDWSNYIDEYNAPGRVRHETEDRDTPQYEAFISHKESLSDHLLWQLLMASPSEEEKKIGSLIIGNLDKDGYLQTNAEDLAQQAEVTPDDIEEVLFLLQSFDPIGVCARDLKECLLLQARNLGLQNTLVTQIISDHINHLENKNYKAICRALKVTLNEVISAVEIITNMEPKPGREFSEDEPQYITPDIYVYKTEDDYAIVINDDGLPKLKVNAFYKQAITRDKEVGGNARNYIQDKLRSAAWLIRSIHQRQKTIYKVMESILKFQKEFFNSGITHLKPMVLRDVAEDIGMHESTISRVTTNKYAYTPQGIFELKYFFNSSIKRVHGEAIASASVQAKIKQLIESEDSRKPYSDSKMAELLKAQNIDIARRTVAKYREMMGVLPSSKRKRFS
ncbi:MAG: RNA polymerase factor sigma-54 [Desulfatitalea sp.]|nr:RNA polymerase factor sigma-54 [Desulfatitalea sp.]NNK01800.1 RNA polymerase factor sigma-54 [Desulfatitalea sp.]